MFYKMIKRLPEQRKKGVHVLGFPHVIKLWEKAWTVLLQNYTNTTIINKLILTDGADLISAKTGSDSFKLHKTILIGAN